mgnify:FL=1
MSLILVNCIVALLFWQTQYVIQADFSKLNQSKLSAQISRIGFELPKHACLDLSNFSGATAARIEELAGIKATQCSPDTCGVCFVVSENPKDVKQRATISIHEASQGYTRVSVELKSAEKLPRDFGKILAKLAAQFDSVVESVPVERPTVH